MMEGPRVIGEAWTLDAINEMSHVQFVEAFGDVAEHSPWVAEMAADCRPFDNMPAMVQAFVASVEQSDQAEQLALIRAHPDLAGKAAIAGTLTSDSTSEQSGAGLDALSSQEFALFERLNMAYKTKFQFPFILAVKGATKDIILSAFEQRLENNVDVEFSEALKQISRIIRFRLEGRVL